MKWITNSLSDGDVRDLIEYRDVFQKLIIIEVNREKARLGNLEYVWSEQKAYSRIDAYQTLSIALDDVQKMFKQFNDTEIKAWQVDK